MKIITSVKGKAMVVPDGLCVGWDVGCEEGSDDGWPRERERVNKAEFKFGFSVVYMMVDLLVERWDLLVEQRVSLKQRTVAKKLHFCLMASHL